MVARKQSRRDVDRCVQIEDLVQSDLTTYANPNNNQLPLYEKPKSQAQVSNPNHPIVRDSHPIVRDSHPIFRPIIHYYPSLLPRFASLLHAFAFSSVHLIHSLAFQTTSSIPIPSTNVGPNRISIPSSSSHPSSSFIFWFPHCIAVTPSGSIPRLVSIFLRKSRVCGGESAFPKSPRGLMLLRQRFYLSTLCRVGLIFIQACCILPSEEKKASYSALVVNTVYVVGDCRL
jgi:hypothetical protein